MNAPTVERPPQDTEASTKYKTDLAASAKELKDAYAEGWRSAKQPNFTEPMYQARIAEIRDGSRQHAFIVGYRAGLRGGSLR